MADRSSESARASQSEPLDEYRRKRDPGATPEPFGKHTATSGIGGSFVVQMHAARRTHYDLRLELDGVLKSWAVPRGPSLDPSEKRLAVQTEDHPLEYRDFEGVIPEGNYGAGSMIVWDRGTWTDLEDARAGLESGKLLFELDGYKLRGVWTLFRLNAPANRRGTKDDDGRQWMLMKKPDGAARPEPNELNQASVLSGLTVEELATRDERLDETRALLEDLALPQSEVDVRRHELMLATPAEKPFSRRNWLYELKYDGYRLLAAKDGEQVFLRYRNGHDATSLFPEIEETVLSLPVERCLLDGEVVVLDDQGRPSFNGLQRRALLSRSLDIAAAVRQTPATFFAFDVVTLEGHDLRTLPLEQRKSILERVVPRLGAVRYLEHIDGKGREFFSQIERMGLEGMVAKKADSPYVGRRSEDWLKYRVDRTADFVIVGLTRPKGHREGFGALHLGIWDPDGRDDTKQPELVYAGRVGTGFGDELLRSLAAKLEPLIVDEPPCRGPLPRGERHVWVEPRLVCEVRYKELTPGSMLRHPVFLGLRDEKAIQECTWPGEDEATSEREEPEPPTQARPVDPEGKAQALTDSSGLSPAKPQRFTNLDKIFWPEDGFTKGDLIDYYRQVAPTMLTYLRDRPLVLTRYPDGIHGKMFFQKHAPEFAPDWVRTETIWSEGSSRAIDYFVCNDLDTLLYLANLGTIPIHIWSSRLATLDRPDWCILDLDPKEAPFSMVVKVAKAIHRLCKDIDLPAYVKTSGSSGLHVLIPLGRALDYEQSRTLGGLIGQIISQEHHEIATVTRNLERRDGKVYIDFVQNGHGRLLVAPLCLRPIEKAPVSTPLRWSEVNSKLQITNHTLESVPKRLARQKSDPLAGVLEDEPDLIGALTRLSERL